MPLAPRLHPRHLLALVAALSLLLFACAPAAPTPAATVAAKPAPTTGSAPSPAVGGSPVASPVASPAASPVAAASPVPRGGTLRGSTLGSPAKVFTPYPEAANHTSARTDVETLIWGYLFDIDYDTMTWVADPRRSMAASLPALSNGGKTFTFTLRDNLKWSDGAPITSADFQFAWDNYSKTENNWVGLTEVARVESFTTPDPKTIAITLKEVMAKDVAYLTLSSLTIPVPKHIWQGKSWGDPTGNPEVARPTVVSGPYMPVELSAERQSFRRNPNWYGASPNLDEIVLVIGSSQTITELLKTGQVDWAQTVPPALWEDIAQAPNVNAFKWSGAIGSYRLLQFNLDRPVLRDVKVREALVRAINREDMVQLEDNLAVPMFGLVPEGSKWRNASLNKFDFDLNKSKALLAEAGFTLQGNVLRGNDGQPVKLEILWPTTSAPRGKQATYIQQQWRQLGIDVTVTQLEANAFTERVSRNKDFDIAMGSFSAGADPDSAKSIYMTGGTQNSTGYSNPRVDDLLKQSAVEQDDARRKTIFDEIQTLVVSDLPQFYTLTLQNTTAFSKKVGGVHPTRGGDILRQGNRQVLDWYLIP